MTYRVFGGLTIRIINREAPSRFLFLDFVVAQIHDKIKLTRAMPTYYDNSTNEKNDDDNSTDTITKTLHLTTSEEKIILK